MADQIYKVQDPQGNIRQISGPAGASDDEIISQAQKLFADIVPAPTLNQIPGGENVPTAQPKPPSLQDKILGAAEVPLTLGSGLIAGMVSPLAGVYGTLTSGKYGTQEGIKAGEKTASNLAQALTYQPRTETAQNTLQSLAGAISGVPPVIGVGNAGMALLPEAISQTRRAVAPAVASTQQRMAALLQPKQTTMMGGGAASTDEALLRQQRAMSQNIPLTKG